MWWALCCFIPGSTSWNLSVTSHRPVINDRLKIHHSLPHLHFWALSLSIWISSPERWWVLGRKGHQHLYPEAQGQGPKNIMSYGYKKKIDACSPTSRWRGGLSLNPSRTSMGFWPFHFSGRIIEVDFTKHSLQFNEQCVQGTVSQWQVQKVWAVGAKKKIKRASAVCGGAQACRKGTRRAPLRTFDHVLFHGRGKYKRQTQHWPFTTIFYTNLISISL